MMHIKTLLSILAFLSFNGSLLAQKEAKQYGPNADKPGAYSVVNRLATPVLQPGEDLKFQFYVTGYGKIQQAKLFFVPSQNLFDLKSSYVITGLLRSDNSFGYRWGATVNQLPGEGLIIGFHKKIHLIKDWIGEPTIFFDAIDSAGTQVLMSETSTLIDDDDVDKGDNAPIDFKLKTLDDIQPGDYVIDLVFTYFNGERWVSHPQQVKFKIENYFERNGTWLGVVVTTATIIGLLVGMMELFERLTPFGKRSKVWLKKLLSGHITRP